jgi:hypothetical protein
MPRQKQTKNTHALMHGKTELLTGDHTSISIIYRNLTGQNPVSPGYIEMMNKQFGITVEPSKLWIGKKT